MEVNVSGWSCPHEDAGACKRLRNIPCDPGQRGCVMHGRFRFVDSAKNRPSFEQMETDDEKE